MSKKSLALLVFALVVLSCAEKKKNEEAPGEVLGETPKVESAQQPEAVVMQSSSTTAPSGQSSGSISSPKIGLKAKGTLDLRPDAPAKATRPPLLAIDPRSFVAVGTYVEGKGKIQRNIFSGQIAVPDDGRSHTLPPCEYPIPAPGLTSTAGLIVDGYLSDWPVGSVIGIDQSGDSPAAETDIREVYFAKDSTSIFIGVKVQGAWPTAVSANKRLLISFRTLNMPVNNSSIPEANFVRGFEIWGPALLEHDGSSYSIVSGSGTSYELVSSGSSVELRLNVSEISGLVGSGPYVLEISSWESASAKFDRVGHHIVGLTDDYACLVPMPKPDASFGNTKMFVFRRSSEAVDAETAEVVFRSMVAGSQASEYVAKDPLRYWDTIPLTVVNVMNPAGVNISNIGIFMEDEISNKYGEKGDIAYLTYVSAHEYLHSYNSSDYQLREHWMPEGHSTWMGNRAIGSYFGDAVWQQNFNANVAEFRAEENANGVQSISDDNWGQSPYSALYYYYKSEALMELLQSKISYLEFLAGVLKSAVNGALIADRDDFFTKIKAQPGFKGAQADNFVPGWWGGTYSGSALPVSLLDDSDADGLLNFQETQLGSNANLADSDGDYVSDLFEKVTGRSITSKEKVDFLAQDHLLSDWEQLIPQHLKTSIYSRESSAPCGEFSNMTRYGLIITEGWLHVAVETKRAPTASENLSVVVFINGGPEQLSISYGSPYVWHLEPASRPAFLLSPYRGSRLEFSYNAAWLGWTGPGGMPPPGMTFHIATFSGATQCDLTDGLTSSAVLK